MNEQAIRRLLGFLTGVGPDFEHEDFVLEVRDGDGVGRLLESSDRVNYLDLASFRRLVELAQTE